MAHVSADRVRTTAVNIGSGAVSVAAAAPTGYRTFSAVLANGDTCYYTIQHQTSGQWEVGLGTYTSSTNTLARTTIISSSNAGLLVTFNTGTVDIFITAPASRIIQTAADGTVTLPASSKVGAALITPQGPITASGLTSATAKLLGRATAATGAVEEITLGTGLSFSGTTLNAAGGAEVSVLTYGADPTGVADSTTAFQNAINSLGSLGGTVIVPPGLYLIDNNLTVGKTTSPYISNVTLKGPTMHQPQPYNTAQYATVANIRLNSAATITLAGGCGLDGLRIIRKGLTFSRTAASSFAGTAISSVGSAGASVRNCMILGFSQAITFSNAGQWVVSDVFIDCTNGVKVDLSYDVTRLTRVHCWPFVTDPFKLSATDAQTINKRAGRAFWFTSLNDWTNVVDCFSFGYNIGYLIDNNATINLIGCGADNTQTHAGSAGFATGNLGANSCVHMVGCLAAAHENNVYLDSSANGTVIMNNCEFWGATNGAGSGFGFANISGVTFLNNVYIHDNLTGYAVVGGTVYGSGVALRGNTTTGSGTINAMPTTVAI